jgi:hypothetical protein
LETGPIRLAASSPVPMRMGTSSSDDVDVVMRNNSNSTIPGADNDTYSDLVNTTTDSEQSLDLILEPVSARKNCSNPVAMTLLHSDDGVEDVTFLLQHDRDESADATTTPVATSRSHTSTRSGSRQSPLACSARVPVQNIIARPVAERPTQQHSPSKQQFYQQQQRHHHQQQQQYYYQQQQQQEQYYQQQQQRPYYQHQYPF